MAAKKATAKKTAKKAAKKSTTKKPVAVASPSDLEEEGKGEEEKQEAEDPEGEDPELVLLTYDPETQGVYNLETQGVFNLETQTVMPAGAVEALTVTKQTINKDSIAFFESQNKQYETFFTGFTATAAVTQSRITDDRDYIRSLREEGDQLRRALMDKEMEIAKMIRASEEAQLERQRLAAEVERGQQLLERVELEHRHKEALRRADLDAVAKTSAPVVAAFAKQVPFLMASMFSGAKGTANGAPAGLPAPTPATPGKAPEPGVSGEGTDEFRALFADVYNTLGNESLACLRAIMCSYAIPGAPPMPKIVSDCLIRFVTQDTPVDKLQALMMHVASSAYIEPPADAAQPVSGALN
jgi:hypothetical protein